MAQLIRTRSSLVLLGLCSAFYFACSPSDDPGGSEPTASGGAVGSGSAQGAGGMVGGGATNSGGAASTGGASGAGGANVPLGSGGDLGGTGASPGTGGAPGVGLGPIMRSDSSYVFEFSGYFFEVDPTQAGVISSFSLNGTNILAPVEYIASFTHGGSQFWLAPQDESWGWPPPEEMDSSPHTVALDGNTVTTTSPAFALKETGNTVSIKKSYTPSLDAGAIDMVFETSNTGPGVATQAPWQITRVARGGITFWPVGDAICGDNGTIPAIPVTDGVYFWHDATLGVGLTDNKFSCDGGGGWMAHVSGSLMLIKSWTDVPAANQHSVDKEIQLYFAGDTTGTRVGDYEEVEMRGALEDIAAGASSTPWNVRWYLRPAPADLSEAGLIAAVQAIIQ